MGGYRSPSVFTGLGGGGGGALGSRFFFGRRRLDHPGPFEIGPDGYLFCSWCKGGGQGYRPVNPTFFFSTAPLSNVFFLGGRVFFVEGGGAVMKGPFEGTISASLLVEETIRHPFIPAHWMGFVVGMWDDRYAACLEGYYYSLTLTLLPKLPYDL